MGKITSSLDTRAGSGVIEVTHSDFPAEANNVTAETYSVSSLSQEFDLTDRSDDATKVFFAPSEFEFEWGNELSDGSSLFKALNDIDQSEDILISLTFTTDSGYEFTDIYTANLEDLKYKRSSRFVTFVGARLFEYDRTINDLFANDFDLGNEEHFIDTLSTGVNAGVFIDYVMKDSTNTNRPTIVNAQNFGEAPYVDHKSQWVVTQLGSTEDATTMLYRLAVMDGAVVGSFLGYNFFVNRLDTSDSVTISEDETESLEIGFSNKNHRSIFTCFTSDTANEANGWGNGYGLIGDQDGLNADGAKQLRVFLFMQSLVPCYWDTADGQYYPELADPFANSAFINVEEQVSQGDIIIEASDGSANVTDFARGDVMAFSANLKKPHLVFGSTASEVILETRALQTADDTYAMQEMSDINLYTNDNIGLAEGACNAYAKSFRADGSKPIELTIWDIDSFNPYQTLYLDSSFPEGVRNSELRPSEIEYDLFSDKVNIKGYII